MAFRGGGGGFACSHTHTEKREEREKWSEDQRTITTQTLARLARWERSMKEKNWTRENISNNVNSKRGSGRQLDKSRQHCVVWLAKLVHWVGSLREGRERKLAATFRG